MDLDHHHLQDHNMNKCEHEVNGLCMVSTELAGLEVPVASDACDACKKCERPQTVNHVTASKAIYTIRNNGLHVPAELYRIVEPIRHEGPGTELKKLISWFWSPAKKCSKCNDRERKMNLWGAGKCRERKKLIVEWLRQSAQKAGIPFSEFIAGSLVDIAISRAEKKQTANQSKRRKVNEDARWAVAVTTAPRKECTLKKCIESIESCGWTPIVFAEPGSTQSHAMTVWNNKRLGVWGNFINSARWCIENTDAKWILTVQDDSLFHPQSKEFVEDCIWPAENAGFISLYTPKHYTIRKDGTIRSPGVNRIYTKSLWGACALVWPREVLKQVIGHPIAVKWAGASPKTTVSENGRKRKRLRSEIDAIYEKRRMNPETIANSDTAIGKILNSMKRAMYFIDPSPVQHIARHSTIGHGGNDGRRNAYRIANHGNSLFDQVPIPETFSLET